MRRGRKRERERERGTEGVQSERDQGMEMENCGSLNADLWTLNFQGWREREGGREGEREIGFSLRILRISETELNTRGTTELPRR